MKLIQLAIVLFGLFSSCKGLRCISCSYQSKGLFRFHPCQFAIENQTEYSQTCSLKEKFCRTETVKSGGHAIVKLQRSCSSSCRSTSDNCYYHGLGLIVETCVKCCQTDNCNSDSIFNRATPMSKHRKLTYLIVTTILSMSLSV